MRYLLRDLTAPDRRRAGEVPAGYGAAMRLPSATWTDERVELLRKLWAENLSASQIAARLGGVTRNAVIGKAHRLKLSGRAVGDRGKRGRPRGLAAACKRHVPKICDLDLVIKSRTMSRANEPRPMPIPEPPPLPVSRRLSMADLGPHDCRWIDGDPRGEHTYCGCKAVPGASWCSGHMAIVYPPTRAAGRLMAA